MFVESVLESISIKYEKLISRRTLLKLARLLILFSTMGNSSSSSSEDSIDEASHVQFHGFDMDEFTSDLRRHEGVVYAVYADPLHGVSRPSLGVGHLIRPGEKYHGAAIGTPVPEAEVELYLQQDAREAVQNSERLFPGFRCMPSAAQLVLANMMFNLGYGG